MIFFKKKKKERKKTQDTPSSTGTGHPPSLVIMTAGNGK